MGFFAGVTAAALAAMMAGIVFGYRTRQELKRRGELLFNSMLAIRAMAGRNLKIRAALDQIYNDEMAQPVRTVIASTYLELGRGVQDAREALEAIQADAPFDAVKRIVIEYSSGLQFQYKPDAAKKLEEARAAREAGERAEQIATIVGAEYANPKFRRADDA